MPIFPGRVTAPDAISPSISSASLRISLDIIAQKVIPAIGRFKKKPVNPEYAPPNKNILPARYATAKFPKNTVLLRWKE